jgi:fibroblast growth factor receptor substrate 2
MNTATTGLDSPLTKLVRTEPNYMNTPISPADPNDAASRMYMNVTPGEFQFGAQQTPTITTTGASQMFPFGRLNSTFSVDPNRCYENLEPSQALRSRLSKPDIFANVDLPAVDRSEPCTPTIAAAAGINYVVLDLDKSATASSISPATSTGHGQLGGAHSNSSIENTSSNLSNNNNSTNNNNNNNNNNNVTSTNQNSGVKPVTTPGSTLLPPESPHKAALGYATIDFNKTVALSNTTIPSQELDSEGSRTTRHNLTAVPIALAPVTRHSNSLSD